MRQKIGATRRRSVRRQKPDQSLPTAEWLAENEIGWGVPHVWFALLALVIVVLRSLAAIGGAPRLVRAIRGRLGGREDPAI